MKNITNYISESKLLVNGRGLDNMFKILDRELSKMNSQKNGADVIGHKLERGDVVALNDYGNNLTLAVVYHVTDKAVYVVYNLKGKNLETYVAPNKVVFLYHLKDDLPMSAFVK